MSFNFLCEHGTSKKLVKKKASIAHHNFLKSTKRELFEAVKLFTFEHFEHGETLHLIKMKIVKIICKYWFNVKQQIFKDSDKEQVRVIAWCDKASPQQYKFYVAASCRERCQST